ncbi:hypothetical protein [Methylocystis parvus]|uniref:hypothetical protein n=1 Tax=Methylocystis parvus TaxID=134 RepID=UPI003C756E0C
MSVFSSQTPVGIEDVYSLAACTSGEVARAYDGLAAAMGADRAATGQVFRTLADWERSRMRSLSDRCGDARPKNGARTALSIIGAEERLELESSALTSPFRALCAAVSHCDRAFVAWAYVAAELEDAPARAAAEELALDALTRAGALRKERRLAWRAERAGMGERMAGGVAEKERLLRAEMRSLPARQALRPGAPVPGRLARYAEELADIYIDRVTKAENAADASRARRRAALSLQRLSALRRAAHEKTA